jgi:hypothetical protein
VQYNVALHNRQLDERLTLFSISSTLEGERLGRPASLSVKI